MSRGPGPRPTDPELLHRVLGSNGRSEPALESADQQVEPAAITETSHLAKAAPDPLLDPASHFLKWLADRRDGLLVLVGVIYAFGYLIWAIFAWRTGLGLLPLLSAQYFVAGILPAFIAAFIAVFLLVGSHFIEAVIAKYPYLRASRRSRRAVMLVIIIVVIVPEVQQFRQLFGYSATVSLSVELSRTLVLGTAMYGAVVYFVWFQHDGYTGLLFKVSKLFVLFTFGLFASLSYYLVIFTHLPQSLGGAAPRCAMIDIDSSKVSSRTGSDLGLLEAPKDQPIASTGNVDLLFSDNNHVIIRNSGKVVDIDRKAVTDIESCHW